MNKKIIENILEEAIEELREEIKVEIKSEIKPLVKNIIIEELKGKVCKESRNKEDIKKKNSKINIFRFILPVGAAYALYIFTALFYLLGVKWSFYFIAENVGGTINFKTFISCIILGVFMCIFLKVSHVFYRLKQNKSTVFLYGLFEYSLGLIILVTTGLIFIEEFLQKPATIMGIKVATYTTFYGALYVMVRGLETARRHFNPEGPAKIFFMDITKETYVSTFFNKILTWK
ncbi:hypothetical protein [Bacillus sp. BD59S]|uniref:hypothetical protein n=1 Tax=Bacillus sp. BD59S TaxID=2499213 RepID=UPI00117E18C3|nr:hypothetical protein [Bacillus sp. BD59S]QDQ07181.1 hypothetical protein EKQ63_19625 [Bacillus sp. BD59S]